MVNALSKAKLANQLSESIGLNKTEAKNLVEIFFEEIRRALEQGKPVKLSGFGNFSLRDKSARPGRNPKTRKDVLVKARRVVTFRSGLKLKNKIEKNV